MPCTLNGDDGIWNIGIFETSIYSACLHGVPMFCCTIAKPEPKTWVSPFSHAIQTGNQSSKKLPMGLQYQILQMHMQNNGHYPLHRSSSFKVTDFGTNESPYATSYTD